jgi:PhnB protein
MLSKLAPTDQFYGDRVSGVEDPFRDSWWIASHKEDLSVAEIEKPAGAGK